MKTSVLRDDDQVLWLTWGEVRSAASKLDSGELPFLEDTARRRLERWRSQHHLKPPFTLPEGRVPSFSWKWVAPLPELRKQEADSLTGLGVSPGRGTGVARVIHSPEDMGGLGRGEILVACTTTPVWMPLLSGTAKPSWWMVAKAGYICARLTAQTHQESDKHDDRAADNARNSKNPRGLKRGCQNCLSRSAPGPPAALLSVPRGRDSGRKHRMSKSEMRDRTAARKKGVEGCGKGAGCEQAPQARGPRITPTPAAAPINPIPPPRSSSEVLSPV